MSCKLNMITKSLLKTFELVEKWRQRELNERIIIQVANHIIKFVPIAGKEEPVELQTFTNILIKREGFGNRDVIKEAVYKLKDDQKIAATRGRDGKTYFSRYK